MIERTLEVKTGQTLLVPELEYDFWDTTLPAGFRSIEVIGLYQDHGTHEQFHSELFGFAESLASLRKAASRQEIAAMRASATAEAGARLAGAVWAAKTATGARGSMISGAKARMAPLFQRKQRVGVEKNAHFSDTGWGYSLNLRIQVLYWSALTSTETALPNRSQPTMRCIWLLLRRV